jgi:hypothetical protein
MPKFPPLWEVSEEDKEKAKQEMMVAQDRLTLYLPLSIILVVLLFPFNWMALAAGFPTSRRFGETKPNIQNEANRDLD